MIQSIPPSDAPASITMNTRKGERSKALLIKYGTRISFSILWIIRYRRVMAIATFHDMPSPIITAGMRAIRGHI